MAFPFIPVRKFTVVTDMPINDVTRFLQAKGEVEHDLFRIERKASVSRRLGVIVTGAVRESGGKTSIDIKVQFDAVTVIIFALVGIALLANTIRFSLFEEDSVKALGFACSIFFWYVLMISVFAWESSEAKSEIQQSVT